MIISFGDKDTERLFLEERPKRIPNQILRAAFKKLLWIDDAIDIEELRNPPGNRLEKLAGDLDGFHSIRINRQWRIVFRWEEDGVYEVSVVDYH